mgnify:CR=1 FL=1
MIEILTKEKELKHYLDVLGYEDTEEDKLRLVIDAVGWLKLTIKKLFKACL